MQSREQLYDKILACWMGKNIGGTLGGPYEGEMERLSLSGPPVLGEEGVLPNDDLDLQLVNLHAIEQRGLRISVQELSEEWLEHVYFPYDEYGYALSNMRRGLKAPLSGSYNNPFTDCMGSPIRSELWAAIAPGKPEIAAYYAYQDAFVDHAGGEGIYGEVFFAALESMAFVESDVFTLIRNALKFIPEESLIYQAVADTVNWYKNGVSYDMVRNLILTKYGNKNFTDAPQNIAFTIVGLIYGEDFADGMIKTVNLGYDTDCTCATLGSVYGILHGTSGIPENWSKPVGEHITISPEVKGFVYPQTITELTERTISIMQRLEFENVDFFKLPQKMDFSCQMFRLPHGAAHNVLDICVTAKDGTALTFQKEKPVNIAFNNNSLGKWDIEVSVEGVKGEEKLCLEKGEVDELTFTLPYRCSDVMTADYRLCIKRKHDGQLWKTYYIDFSLPVAAAWKVDGKEIYGDDGLMKFNSHGFHRAETTIDVPSARTIKLICVSSDPVNLILDGKTVVESAVTGFYMPAFHRCPDNQYKTVDLTAGRHNIAVEICAGSEESRAMVIPVSIENPECSGKNFCFIDCTIGRK